MNRVMEMISNELYDLYDRGTIEESELYERAECMLYHFGFAATYDEVMQIVNSVLEDSY